MNIIKKIIENIQSAYIRYKGERRNGSYKYKKCISPKEAKAIKKGTFLSEYPYLNKEK